MQDKDMQGNIMQGNSKVQKKVKMPVSHATIYKMMIWVVMIATGVFFVKNLLELSIVGAVVTGISMVVFGITFYMMSARNVVVAVRELVLSASTVIMIFFISMFSGESYSDDFCMFLAAIGFSGMFMNVKATRMQILLADLCLLIMYISSPEKGGNLGQYILCWAGFEFAAELFYQTIKRGRAFIDISDVRAKQAEDTLTTMRSMGNKIQDDFDESSIMIDRNTEGLKTGSASIAKRTGEIAGSCEEVHDKIIDTEKSIESLNDEVKRFETALNQNSANMEAMTEQLNSIGDVIHNSNDVFAAMEQKMKAAAKITEEISNISFNTTTLSFNASIEAARAGEAGVGFEVVANEMRNLSVTSNKFSEQVAEVIGELQNQVTETVAQFNQSIKALDESENTMKELQESFRHLTKRFDALYENIEEQNENVTMVENIFNQLSRRVSEMDSFVADNQRSVEGIIDAMNEYKVNINKVVENTRNV